ncbi:MAG TPA: hypothetical protein VHV54_22080, partial [Candidatus Binatia bacterium]|nr:hypothetical protein [Candidatus Binatia bacterium]
GLHPLGQTETGLVVPLLGAREATFMGGVIIMVMTLVTAWRIPGIAKFSWHQLEENAPPARAATEKRAAG